MARVRMKEKTNCREFSARETGVSGASAPTTALWLPSKENGVVVGHNSVVTNVWFPDQG